VRVYRRIKADAKIRIAAKSAWSGWWSQAESNRRPLQCHCHGLLFLAIYDSFRCLFIQLKIEGFWPILISGRFPKLLFGGDLVAI
jgi:hypothetical protein